MVRHYYKKIIKIAISCFLILVIVWLYLADFSKNKTIEYGVSFSQKYAAELNLDWQETYLALLDDLQVKKLRLMAYWDLLEPMAGSYDFTDLDWQINEAESRGAQIILTIGHRLPRWPECHWPNWTYTLNQSEREGQILQLLKTIIERYQNTSAIIAWQVENEPFLRIFGQCPPPNNDFYKQEIKLVKLLDARPIIVTESGELSTWFRAAGLADYVGASVYRITWNKHFGYLYYPLPPAYYYLKAQLVKWLTPAKDIFVSEMQMEPWLGLPVVWTSLSDQSHSMNLNRFIKNFNYVKRSGLSPVYFWGGEWWYWLKEQGNGDIWEAARKIFN